MKISVTISCAVFFLVSSVAAEDFFFTQNRTPTGITGGLVIKNFQGEVVKELADVASDFNILHFDPLRRIVMGTDELTEGDDWDGNWTNVNRMTIDGEFLGERGYRGDLTRAFAVDPIHGLLYASDEQFTVASYLKSGSAGKYNVQMSRDATAIAGIGLPQQSGSLFLLGGTNGPSYVLSKVTPGGWSELGYYVSSDTELAIDASNQRLYVLGTPASTHVRELISMNLDGGNQMTHVVGSEVPAGNRIEVDSHGGYLYLSGGSELHRMPLMGNQIETVCTDCIVGGAFALISVAGLHRPGDADMDNDVDLSDYNTLAENFGSGGRNWYDANFDGDQSVDLGDYNLLATNFAPGGYDKMSFLNSSSTTGEPLATVPEPSARILATLGLLVWMCFSCRVKPFRFAVCA